MLTSCALYLKSSLKDLMVTSLKASYPRYVILLIIYLHKINIFKGYY